MSILLTIILMVISTIIGATGSLFLKLGSPGFSLDFTSSGIKRLLCNWRLILGIVLYGISTIIFIYLLRGEDLSFLYPLTSLSYIFVTILSALALKERINKYKVLGIALIIVGVVLITFKI